MGVISTALSLTASLPPHKEFHGRSSQLHPGWYSIISKSVHSTLAPGQLTTATDGQPVPHVAHVSCPLVQEAHTCCSPAFSAGTLHQTGW